MFWVNWSVVMPCLSSRTNESPPAGMFLALRSMRVLSTSWVGTRIVPPPPVILYGTFDAESAVVTEPASAELRPVYSGAYVGFDAQLMNVMPAKTTAITPRMVIAFWPGVKPSTNRRLCCLRRSTSTTGIRPACS